MKDRRIALKVKIKSLAEEARIIRLEERKAKDRGDYRLLLSLQRHRKEDVRAEARASHLAYGMMKIKSYPAMEGSCHTPVDEGAVSRILSSFGPVYDCDNESYDDYLARRDVTGALRRGQMVVFIELNRRQCLEYQNSASDRAAKRLARRIRCNQAHAKRRQLPPEQRNHFPLELLEHSAQ